MTEKILIIALTIVVLGGALFWMYVLSNEELPWISRIDPVSPNPLPPTSVVPPPVVVPPVQITPPPAITPGPTSPLPFVTPRPAPPPPATIPTPLPPPSTGSGATLSFDPFFYSASVGESFVVNLIIDTGGSSVVAMSGYITFDDSVLEVADIDTSKSVFSIEAEKVAYPGEIRISRGKITPGFNGVGPVASIVFTPKVRGTGGLIEFNWNGINQGPSRVIVDDSNGTDILTNAFGATFEIL
jgi:hypothetical protein